MNFRKIKSFISLLIVFSMLITVVPTVFASEEAYSKFSDFPTGWSKTAMEHAVDNGLLNGKSDSTINPEDYLTRAEMATIINRVFGSTVKADISKYTDVTPGDWYYDEIAKAVNMRTFVGDSGTTMNPDGNITREEVFTVIARALVLETEDYSSLDQFPDKDITSDWAKSASAILVAKDYIHGNDEGNLCPQCYITREEFAQMMYNIIKTYYVAPGTYNTTGEDSTLTRSADVTIENITVDGDLIVGDGVGDGWVYLKNVTVNGRLLCRGGKIRITNSKVNEHVVVYNVNGTVHFDNYRSEAVFKGIRELTPATFKMGGGGGSYTPVPQPQYYTVSFHNGANPQAFTTASINKAAADGNRNLAGINQSLDSIYSQYLGTQLPAYNRNSLGYNAMGTTYQHQVDKEYIYEKTPGVWEVFTNTTDVNEDIDVYYAAKRFVAEGKIAQLSTPYSLELRYDSKSRAIDSLKDALITTGATLEKNVVKNEINSRIRQVYAELNNETQMIDLDGNILDRDYGLKIVDVIDYNKIELEVNAHISNLLNGTAEEIETFISLLDMKSLVEQIGGKNLISTLMANPTTLDLLIDKVGTNDAFIVKIIDNGTYNNKIISLLKTGENKENLIAYLAKDEIKAEIIKTIKANPTFKNLLADENNTSFRNTITEEVKKSAGFKTILTTDNAYKTNIINTIKADKNKIKDIALKLVKDDEFKKKVVKEVAYPLSETNTEGKKAKQTKDAILNIISTSSTISSELKNGVTMPNVYEAMIQYYVEGDHNYSVTIRKRDFAEKYNPMINSLIEDAVVEYFNYNPQTDSQKPSGYDMIDEYFKTSLDTIINDIIKNYANGDYDNAEAGTAGAQIKKFIDDELPTHIVNALLDYVDPEVTLDTQIETVITDNLIAFVIKYLNGESIAPDIVAVMEENIITFIRDYFAGTSGIAGNADIKNLTDDLKAGFIVELKKDLDNLKAELNTYINDMSDKDVNDLIVEFADAEMIATYIYGLTPDQKIELKTTIMNFLETYDPYTEFMEAFEHKKNSFVVKKSNTHFVKAVGQAIYGFDFDEILVLLNEKGFAPMIKFLGKDVVNDMFVGSKNAYWNNLSPIIAEVEASADPDIERYYTTSMSITVNVPSILHGIYLNYGNTFKNKIETNGIYDYNNNSALKQLVNQDWFNLIIGYDANRIDDSTGATGYYIRDYMDYYCMILDTLILFDSALCYYNNLDDETFKDVKKSLTKEFLAFIEKLEKLPDDLANGNPIVKNYTLQDLINKVDEANNALASFGGTGTASQLSAISDVVNTLRGILTDLGHGNLPNGNSVDDLAILSSKLSDVINAMNENRYDECNDTFKELINRAMLRLDTMLDEIDQTGNLPASSLISRIAILSRLFNKFSSQIKSVVSIAADVNFASINEFIDSEKYEDILFGREEDNIFNIDSVMNIVKGKLGAVDKTGYDQTSRIYIIDQYSKVKGENRIMLQRRFY